MMNYPWKGSSFKVMHVFILNAAGKPILPYIKRQDHSAYDDRCIVCLINIIPKPPQGVFLAILNTTAPRLGVKIDLVNLPTELNIL